MSPLLLVGWLLAVTAASLLLLARRSARRSTERVLRACHELRGPLQNVVLALGAEESSSMGRSASAAALAVELTRATRAVDDLGAATRHGREPDERRRVDLAPVVRDLVAVHDLVARSSGRRVVLAGTPADAAVMGDRSRLAQAIGNLLQNAIEHGAGTVSVGLTADQGRVHVEVRDEGHGLRVPIDALLRQRRRGGRGRGIRIVAESLGAHGGALRSAPSAAGARMVADLPRARAVVR